MTRYLLIGGSGLVGRHVHAALDGRDVIVTVHRAPLEASVPLDVTDPIAVRSAISAGRPDVVILAAAEAHVERCEREPDATRAINVAAASTVAEATWRVNALLAVFSSEYVFDGAAGPYGEDDAVSPLNEYGRQKVELEAIARRGRHLICRLSGVFGSEPGRKNFVLQLIDRLRSGGTFPVASDQVITPTYAPSLAAAFVRLIDKSANGTFNLCGPQVLPRVEFARMIADTFQLPAEGITPVPTAELGLAAVRPLGAGLSDRKLRGAIGHGLADPADALREMAQEGV